MAGETRGKPVDVKAQPSAILEGLDERLRGEVRGVFPFETVVDEGTDLHDPDWDVLLIQKSWITRSPSLFTVAFGETLAFGVRLWPPLEERTPEMEAASGGCNVTYGSTTEARDLYVPDALPDGVARLVHSDLIPGFNAGQPKRRLRILKGAHSFSNTAPAVQNPDWYLDPFLIASDDAVLAGRVRRQGQDGRDGELWLLPEWVPNPRAWVQAAWRAWYEAFPDRIPKPPDWSDSPTWHTPEEAKVTAKVNAVLDEKRRVLANLAESAEALEKEFVKAREAAEAGPRRMLSAQGEDLVTAVQGVLEDLGFEVQNMDLIREVGDRREDLRVRDADDYEAIAEVRGYKGGAQSNDLQRIGRFEALYAMETGHLPSARWYIANELLNQDPGTRPKVLLASKPDDVRAWGEDSGVLISSVALYRLWQKVMSEEIDKDEARRMLRDSRGQFAV